jgi:proteasome accessory factor C
MDASAQSRSEDRFRRLLFLLPLAARPGGASLIRLAEALEVTPETLQEDLLELEDREFYRPGGWVDELDVSLVGDQVEVTRTGGLDRPQRLTPAETFCLALALQSASAASHLHDQDARVSLLQRAQTHLAQRMGEGDRAFDLLLHAEDSVPDPKGIRQTLIRARREQTPCVLRYLKPRAADPELRTVHPYGLVHVNGEWYSLAWCQSAEAIRSFRLDRILEAEVLDGHFEVPEDFDPQALLPEAHRFAGEAAIEAILRYTPRIARWIRQYARFHPVEWHEEPEGSIVVRHRVVDPHWIESHALSFGIDAEVLAPPELRTRIRAVAEQIAQGRSERG